MGAELAQCRKCGSFTLLAVSPVKVAVDVSPLDGAGYTQAVIGRVELYAAEKGRNGAWKLRTARAGHDVVSWSPTGQQEGPERLHRAHPCPAEYSRPVKPLPKAPDPPATHGAGKGGNHPPTAPVAGESARRPSAAAPATRRPSEVGVRCHICRKLIDQTTEEFTGIFHERWIWAVHENCE